MSRARTGRHTRLALLGAWALATCSDITLARAQGFDWQLPAGFPTPRVPADNPMNAEKVELGRHLFYDTRLSGAGNTACATCHRQELAFTDGRARARGAEGELHPHGTPSLANVAYAPTLGWADPETRSLEEQATIPLFGLHPVEMGVTGAEERVLSRLRGDTGYTRMFRAAFPDTEEPLTLLHVRRALAAFQRTLISGNSAYDRLVYEDDHQSLGPVAWQGMRLFFSERLGCAQCHAGPSFSGPLDFEGRESVEPRFYNTGLYNLDGEGDYPPGGRGLAEHSGRASDTGHFRTPTLRNVALTAPYMHDGSIPTLHEVLRHYAAGGRNWRDPQGSDRAIPNPHQDERVGEIDLEEPEIHALVAFLESLTDWKFVRDPRFANPFSDSATPTRPLTPRAATTH